MTRVYCAGPLFNEPERVEMAAIARVLEMAGHETFLPQRDGFELSAIRQQFAQIGLSAEQSGQMLHRCIFDLDIYHLLQWSDVCVANLNGHVPDEGTVVEAALTWAAGRPLVLYKADDRAPFEGEDNPMVTCLTDLRVMAEIEQLPQAVDEALSNSADLSTDLPDTLHRGQQVKDAIESARPTDRSDTSDGAGDTSADVPDVTRLAAALAAIYAR